MKLKNVLFLAILSSVISMSAIDIDPDAIIQKAKDFGETVENGIKQGFEKAISSIESVGKTIFNDIENGVESITSQIKSGAISGIDAINAQFKVMKLKTQQEFVQGKLQLLGTLKKADSTFKGISEKAINGIKGVTVNLESKMKGVGKDVFEGLKTAAFKIKYGFTWLGDKIDKYGSMAIEMVKGLVGKGKKPDYGSILRDLMKNITYCSVLPTFYKKADANKISKFTQRCKKDIKYADEQGDDSSSTSNGDSGLADLDPKTKDQVMPMVIYNAYAQAWKKYDDHVPSEGKFNKHLKWADIEGIVKPLGVTFTEEQQKNLQNALSTGNIMKPIPDSELTKAIVTPVIKQGLDKAIKLPDPLPENLQKLFEQIDKSFYVSTVAFAAITQLLANESIRKAFTWDTFKPFLKPYNITLTHDQITAIKKAFGTNTAMPDFDAQAAIEKKVYHNMIIEGLNSQLCSKPDNQSDCQSQSSLCPKGQCVTIDNVEQFPSTAFRFFHCFGYMFGKYYNWDDIQQILTPYKDYLPGGEFSESAVEVLKKDLQAKEAPADCAFGT